MPDPVLPVTLAGFLLTASVTTSPELLLSTGVLLVAVAASHARNGQRLKSLEKSLERIEEKGACSFPGCPFGYHQQEQGGRGK